ncbi:hypothetical protein QR680_014569 [Steinernema hermaphroditum]|uniref:Uncharacterized protein n=1 Tax=Steinernema hermaphroditum TaxID=289476 RepID=A0AA39IAZ7_9BILA|nr:hypothetical protein QR680_014569 [Steinernema hermaphroditum]
MTTLSISLCVKLRTNSLVVAVLCLSLNPLNVSDGNPDLWLASNYRLILAGIYTDDFVATTIDTVDISQKNPMPQKRKLPKLSAYVILQLCIASFLFFVRLDSVIFSELDVS